MAPAKAHKTAIAGRLVGYARVSTDEQGTDPRRDRPRGGAPFAKTHYISGVYA
jgi:DNA invertase Pin-like site-specific DNA recombinase